MPHRPVPQHRSLMFALGLAACAPGVQPGPQPSVQCHTWQRCQLPAAVAYDSAAFVIEATLDSVTPDTIVYIDGVPVQADPVYLPRVLRAWKGTPASPLHVVPQRPPSLDGCWDCRFGAVAIAPDSTFVLYLRRMFPADTAGPYQILRVVTGPGREEERRLLDRRGRSRARPNQRL